MKNKPSSSAVLSDWDFTLVGQFTLFPWAKHLIKLNLINPHTILDLNKIFLQLEKRVIGYEDFCILTAEVFGKSLIHKTVNEIHNAAAIFANESHLQLYEYSYKLFRLLNKLQVKLFIVSGAPIEPLAAFSEKLGFTVIGALEFESNSAGLYTGNIIINHGLKKEKERVANEINACYKVIVAFGDSESDIPLLKVAEKRVIVSTSIVKIKSIKGFRVTNYSPQELINAIDNLII